MSEPLYIFVPSPNDNISPITGSANATRFYELSKRHLQDGGSARFIMGRNTRFDYPVGECVRVDFPPFLTRNERWRDLITGWMGMPRYCRASRYANAAQAIEADFTGPVLFYNDAAALTTFRNRSPQARLVLYCGNQIWTTFSNSEIRRMLRLADHIICISDFLANDLKQRLRKACRRNEYDRLQQKIATIPNGVDLEMFHPAEAKEERSSPPVALFVGRVQPVKGPHLLIEAARQLHDAGQPLAVRIVGSQAFTAEAALSDYEKSLRELAAPLGELVEFQPFVTRHEIADEYRKADIFAMPSVWHEPFGMTLLEGMATGLPTVATRRGAIPDTGGDALQYFEPTNVEELTAILAELISDPAARHEWGQKARARAEEFSWDRHYNELVCALETSSGK
jgi:glycosyltransferase involved in cell wall biosynthesis